jgi:hypothetical protein
MRSFTAKLRQCSFVDRAMSGREEASIKASAETADVNRQSKDDDEARGIDRLHNLESESSYWNVEGIGRDSAAAACGALALQSLNWQSDYIWKGRRKPCTLECVGACIGFGKCSVNHPFVGVKAHMSSSSYRRKSRNIPLSESRYRIWSLLLGALQAMQRRPWSGTTIAARMTKAAK